MSIRPERSGDEAAIHDLTNEAFFGKSYSDGTEAALVGKLRDAGVLSVSLVAERDAEIVGHVAFSRVDVSNGTTDWYGLGPLSVAPERQGRGVGSRLVGEGLSAIKSLGARGCILVGDPNYYSRFGFRGDCGLTYGDVPDKYVQGLAFTGDIPTGAVEFHPAFGGQ
ncbi:MAG: N-acetyltransferase [Pseudomonadota bacterium]